jgi:hypothetical protein
MAREPRWQISTMVWLGRKSRMRPEISSIGIFSAPGMCPAANSLGERTSTNWSAGGATPQAPELLEHRPFSSWLDIIAAINCAPIEKEQRNAKKDSGNR